MSGKWHQREYVFSVNRVPFLVCWYDANCWKKGQVLSSTCKIKSDMRKFYIEWCYFITWLTTIPQTPQYVIAPLFISHCVIHLKVHTSQCLNSAPRAVVGAVSKAWYLGQGLNLLECLTGCCTNQGEFKDQMLVLQWMGHTSLGLEEVQGTEKAPPGSKFHI